MDVWSRVVNLAVPPSIQQYKNGLMYNLQNIPISHDRPYASFAEQTAGLFHSMVLPDAFMELYVAAYGADLPEVRAYEQYAATRRHPERHFVDVDVSMYARQKSYRELETHGTDFLYAVSQQEKKKHRELLCLSEDEDSEGMTIYIMWSVFPFHVPQGSDVSVEYLVMRYRNATVYGAVVCGRKQIDVLRRCLQRDNAPQVVFGRLSLRNIGAWGDQFLHANGLIIKPRERTFSRAEPNGSKYNIPFPEHVNVSELLKWLYYFKESEYHPQALYDFMGIHNSIVEAVLLEWFPAFLGHILGLPQLRYIPLEISCPNIGVQFMQEPTTDYSGYCTVWSIYLIHLQLLNPSWSIGDINDYVVVKRDRAELLDFIQRYIDFVEAVLALKLRPTDRTVPRVIYLTTIERPTLRGRQERLVRSYRDLPPNALIHIQRSRARSQKRSQGREKK